MGFWRSLYYLLSWDYLGSAERDAMSEQHQRKERMLKELVSEISKKNIEQRLTPKKRSYCEVVDHQLENLYLHMM
jgi:predicted phosphatase